MKSLVSIIKPKSGFSHVAHLFLTTLLPLLVYIMVRIDFIPLAAILILLSKWRMFAVRPRYWAANILANAVDITVGLSIVIFMSNSTSGPAQLLWAILYGVWLLLIKPGSSIPKVSVQACLAQACGLSAVFLSSGDAPLLVLVAASWLICFISARHFFTSFEEPYASLYANFWGYTGAALAWILGHWLLFYGVIAQPVVLLTVVGFGLAALYYLDQTERLSPVWRRQFIVMMLAIIAVVLVFSDWGDQTI